MCVLLPLLLCTSAYAAIVNRVPLKSDATSWFIGEWGECSEPCGSGGEQMRAVFCHRVNQLTGGFYRVKEHHCTQKMPIHVRECNRFACPFWTTGEWSNCSVECGSGYNTRDVMCKGQQTADTPVSTLSSSLCTEEPAPAWHKTCEMPACQGLHYKIGEWTVDPYVRLIEMRRVQCLDREGVEHNLEQCQNATGELPMRIRALFEWHASEWSECSVGCGLGTQSRNVTCQSRLRNMKNHSNEQAASGPPAPTKGRHDVQVGLTLSGTGFYGMNAATMEEHMYGHECSELSDRPATSRPCKSEKSCGQKKRQ